MPGIEVHFLLLGTFTQRRFRLFLVDKLVGNEESTGKCLWPYLNAKLRQSPGLQLLSGWLISGQGIIDRRKPP